MRNHGVEPIGSLHDLVGRVWWDLAGPPCAVQLAGLLDVADSTRLLYGTDYCWTSTAAVEDASRRLDEMTVSDVPDWRARTAANAYA